MSLPNLGESRLALPYSSNVPMNMEAR